MSKRSPLFLALLSIALLAAAAYFYNKANKKKFDWSDNLSNQAYNERNDQPYGTLVAHRLFEAYFPDHTVIDLQKNIARELPVAQKDPASYVFIGEAMYLDSLSTARLLTFVGQGNTAFISSKTIPFDLMFHLYYEECDETGWDDYAMFGDTFTRLSLKTPALSAAETRWHYARQNIPSAYTWHFIDKTYFCDEQPQRVLGHLNDSLINFAEFPYRNGRFLLHTTPLAFSNYSLLRKATRPYAEGVIAHLPKGNVYWDAMSRIPEQAGRKRNNSAASRSFETEHPLAYILQQPSLAWAWYILIGLALVWVVFRAKRRQRIIPVLPPNENTSYEFINIIANLHFQNRNYQGLCKQNMKLFLAHIRERYNLTVPTDAQSGVPRTDPDFFNALSRVSDVPEEQIRGIFKQYVAAIQFHPTEAMMVDLHMAMDGFYKRAK
jgi:hypothetical protein